ncbi:MAG: hypothetical protein RMJ86_06265, partial [Anaerolineae bacterium]|nr:hypothetical protein [Anaerolineae bacterium]
MRGWDGGKRVWGRKRWLAVDSAGLIHAAAVRPADVPEGEGGQERLRQAGEAGQLRQVAVVWVREQLGWRVEVVRRRGRAFAV